ncbi:MAG: UDP-N-acetylmuramate--L-alanine ligase [Planctomycetota bacterium]|nr:UDP-N-acetylmuramate--L-alanine ligase [Planctomycetota bacterium]
MIDDAPIPDKVYIIGIGGAATSGLAMLLKARGHDVSGSDQNDQLKDRLLGADIRFFSGHDARNLPQDTGLVIRSLAIPDHNDELVEAARLKIEVLKYSEVLGRLSAQGHAIAVSGTHGKTSTTGILTSIMMAAGRDPSVLLGGELESMDGRNWRNGSGEDFIVEACEYQKSFLNLCPSAGIVTNIEVDHPEIYCDLAAVQESFGDFLRGFRPGSPVVVPELHADLLRKVGADVRLIIFGLDQGEGWRSKMLKKGLNSLIEMRVDDRSLFKVTLNFPGKHTMLNATAAAALAYSLGVDLESIRTGIENYRGVKRRFEKREVIDGVDWFDDYAHHPTEVKMTLETAREVYPDRKIWAIFQPHQALRLEVFFEEFVASFDASNEVLLLPIFHARENPLQFPTDMLQGFAKRLRERQIPVRIVGFEEAIHELPEIIAPGDVVMALGAGSIDKIGVRIAHMGRDLEASR